MSQIADRQIHVDMNALSMCTLLREDGDPVSIRSLWQNHPAILVFLRHFACDACRQHAVEVWENRAKYESTGATIHFIGNGAPNFLQKFKQEFGLHEASMYTDPSLKTFQAAGFRKGFWIDPGALYSRPEFLYKAILQAMKKENNGYGNVWQLGGVLAVRPGGSPTYQFTSLAVGHYPPIKDGPIMADAKSKG